DFDRLQQRLAASGRLERQSEEARQILTKRAVARQHGVELAALFQPVVGTTIPGGLCQARSIDRGAERSDGLITVGVDQRVNSAEHTTQTIAGLTAQSLALSLDRVARPPRHTGQEQIVHLDDVVEQKLAGFHQIAGNQRVTLGGREAPEITSIIATAKLTKLLHNVWIESIEAGAASEQAFDEMETVDVALDDASIRRTRVVLQPKQTGSGIAVWHFQQQVDRFPQPGWQARGDHLEQFGVRLCDDGVDDPFERAW